jgi:ABC-2 type transport system permease protein
MSSYLISLDSSRKMKLTYVKVIFALLSRDIAVLRKTFMFFIIRVIMQPLLFVFVFTYVFPKIGQGVGGGGAKSAEFSTLLVAGVVGISIIFQAIQAVALPLVQEFGFTKEIEDRALAPIPVWGLAVEKILSGALQATVAAIVVFPVVFSSQLPRFIFILIGRFCLQLFPYQRYFRGFWV